MLLEVRAANSSSTRYRYLGTLRLMIASDVNVEGPENANLLECLNPNIHAKFDEKQRTVDVDDALLMPIEIRDDAAICSFGNGLVAVAVGAENTNV